MSIKELNPLIEIIDRNNQEINRRIEESSTRTDKALNQMSNGIEKLSDAIVKQGERHAAFEEKFLSQNESINRLDQNQKEMGIKMDRKFEHIESELDDVKADTALNSTVRKSAIWLAGVIITAFVGGISIVSYVG